jgi:hypothetical protein
MTDISSRVAACIARSRFAGAAPAPADPAGPPDSIQLVQLVVALETEFSIKVGLPEMMRAENWSSPEAVAALVRRLLARPGP